MILDVHYFCDSETNKTNTNNYNEGLEDAQRAVGGMLLYNNNVHDDRRWWSQTKKMYEHRNQDLRDTGAMTEADNERDSGAVQSSSCFPLLSQLNNSIYQI